MIEALVIVVIVLIAFGVLVWAEINYLTIAQPWLGLVILLTVLIGVLIVLQRLGILNVGSL
jgi:hypothetical protein